VGWCHGALMWSWQCLQHTPAVTHVTVPAPWRAFTASFGGCALAAPLPYPHHLPPLLRLVQVSDAALTHLLHAAVLGSAARADEEDVISRLTARKQPSAGEGGPAVRVCVCVCVFTGREWRPAWRPAWAGMG
jgi:hypothetical protein